MDELSLCSREDFERVLERYGKMLYRLAFSRTGNYHDANDVVQDAMLRYIRSEKCFNDEEHRKAWLIKITINCSKSFHSSGWNRHRSGEEMDEEKFGSYDGDLNKVDTKNAVLKAVLELPAKYRTVVHLFYYEDMTIEEICRVLDATEGAVKTQLHRARNMLKSKLEGV